MYSFDQFNQLGYFGPFPALDPVQARSILTKSIKTPDRILPWLKGRHSVDRTMAALAQHPSIINKLQKLLGDDIILWGCQIIKQMPGKQHHWHVDFEHMQWDGVSVWLALENVVAQDSVSLITGSHRLTTAPQDYHSQDRETDKLLKEARKLVADAELIDLDIHDGEFFIFQGTTRHSTRNTSNLPRYAALFQYCRPDQKVRACKDIQYPEVKWHSFQPECLLVSGRDEYRINKIIQLEQCGSLRKKVLSLIWYAPRSLLYKMRKRTLGMTARSNQG